MEVAGEYVKNHFSREWEQKPEWSILRNWQFRSLRETEMRTVFTSINQSINKQPNKAKVPKPH